MKTNRKIHLNLACNPLRNRRAFFSLLSVMALLAVMIFLWAGSVYVRSGRRIKETRASVAETETRIKEMEREEIKLDKDIGKAEKERGDTVDLINSIIVLKTFSWTEFFSRLEKALPGSSYITSLNPKFYPDALLEIELNVVSPGLDELLVLLQNLRTEGFSRIRLIRESRDESGIAAYIVLSLEEAKQK